MTDRDTRRIENDGFDAAPSARGRAEGLEAVLGTYGARAGEYAALFGKVESLPDADLSLVGDWARRIEGKVLDVGCGPGQWTEWIGELGIAVEGIDPVPEFIELAREAYSARVFRPARAEDTGAADGEFGGVLAWYSLIHTEPECIGDALSEFHRVLRPGGGLALGFFEGPVLEPFEHAITTAYFWPMDLLLREIRAAGFTVAHTEARNDPGARRHGAVTAVRDA